jgi:hypothetical protein
MNNLAFRRQYLLTNIPVEKIDGWNYYEIPGMGGNLHLYCHPDLEVTKEQQDGRTLVLLGYVLDPYNPDLSNSGIIGKLVKLSNLEELFKETAKLCGRFVMLYTSDKGSYIFSDATGFREIYYSFGTDKMFFGSTPDLINKFLNAEKDNDPAILEFLESPEYKQATKWMGTRTLFKGIYHLLPNNYIDLVSKSYHRYWPNKKRQPISLKEGARIMAEILKGTMAAAAKRYTLHQAITSGYDTRLLLAASKDYLKQIKFFVMKASELDENKSDTVWAKEIAAKYNLDFEVIEAYKLTVDPAFQETFYKNNILARDRFLKFFYWTYTRKYDNTYWVTGTFGNEILRISTPYSEKKSTGYMITQRFNYSKYSYAVKSIDEWLKDAEKACHDNGYNVMNLFYWEQYIGNWGNLASSEQNIIRDEIRPFNCHKLIETYMALHDKYRYRDNPEGHKAIIDVLWKELNTMPYFHPNPRIDRTKKFFRFFGLERILDNFSYWIRDKFHYKK